jgi:glycosyltransferase involved in cell wall biosynthesis
MNRGPTTSDSKKVSFIVPTLKRPDFLRRCLDAIADQSIPAYEVFVGIMPDDFASLSVLAMAAISIPVVPVNAGGRGVVGSMSSCLPLASGEFIALLDDDVEIPRHWTESMCRHLERNGDVTAVGGRDLLQDYPEMRLNEPQTLDVGRLHWYGRITGEHHRAGGDLRRVDILRGSNCLFRRSFLCAVGFEQQLRGRGAQVHWELVLALRAKEGNNAFLFDPNIKVIHHTAPRHDNDQLHRGIFDADALFDMSYNEMFAMSAYGSQYMRIASFAYGLIVGGGYSPGIFKACVMLIRRERPIWKRLIVSMRGRVEGWLAGARTRRQRLSDNNRRIISKEGMEISAD